jgi:glycosyltransferase involved in cell wall biosynthesis
MNVLTITTWDSAGEQFNGYLVHRELLRQGHQSDMAVMFKEKDDPEIHVLGNRLTRFFDKTAVKLIEEILGIRCLLPISGLFLFLKKYYGEADIIHLQIIHGNPFFSLLLLPLITRRHRVIWTLHDPWMITGHCVYPLDCEKWKSGCGSCPDLLLPFPVRRDATSFMWRVKRWLLDRSRLDIVVVSKWMDELVGASPLVSRFPRHIIPLGMDTDRCAGFDRDVFRERHSIPPDVLVIAFRYRGDQDSIKGWPYIEEALLKAELDRPVCLVAFDQTGGMERLKERYQVVQLGWTPTHEPVLEALAAADLFLMPSVAEAFGMMAVESMACGTPVIVFEGTALPDVVQAPIGGIAVPRDADALARAIETVLQDRELYDRLVENGRRIAGEEYSLEQYTQRHIDLYRQLISEKEGEIPS